VRSESWQKSVYWFRVSIKSSLVSLDNIPLQFTLFPWPIRTQKIFNCKTDLFHILVYNCQYCPNDQ